MLISYKKILDQRKQHFIQITYSSFYIKGTCSSLFFKARTIELIDHNFYFMATLIKK